MTGIYFSGTGNSKHCVEVFLQKLGGDAKAYSIEDEAVIEAISESRKIVIGYPVQYSNIPKILRDFVEKNAQVWKGKQIFVIATMGLFSGDGAGVLARLLQKHGAEITGGLHLKMPDSIADEKVLKRTFAKNQDLVKQAEEKTAYAVKQVKAGKPPQEGLRIWNRLAGFFGQRLYFGYKAMHYRHRVKIDKEKCCGCGKCEHLCPMKNLKIQEHVATALENCTLCYRCVNHCPRQAITILGKQVVAQTLIEKYKNI